MWLTLAKLLVAIAAAIPPLLRELDKLRDQQRAADALRRQAEKDARVDEAIAAANQGQGPETKDL